MNGAKGHRDAGDKAFGPDMSDGLGAGKLSWHGQANGGAARLEIQTVVVLERTSLAHIQSFIYPISSYFPVDARARLPTAGTVVSIFLWDFTCSSPVRPVGEKGGILLLSQHPRIPAGQL